MKPESEEPAEKDTENSTVTGDVIGDTAYSERFVLKILLKLANLDTLKDEILEKTFEEDLCTLWDMTAERDVVLFLQKHNILNLINFALPAIETPRIIEILVGIIGNMCCQKEAVISLLKMDSFLSFLIEYIKSDDSLVLIQLLRLINSNLFLAIDNDIAVWLKLFINTGYSNALYYILKNSSNKDVLVVALENLNTICSYCNTEKFRTDFFGHFVNTEALESLITAFKEITVKQKELCEQEELERILIISLQITLNLVGFDKSVEMFCDSKDEVAAMISIVLNYYKNKLVCQKEIDMDLVDIIDSTNTIVNVLQINETHELDKYFLQSHSIWKAITSVSKSDKNGASKFEEDERDELQVFSKQIKTSLSTLMFKYIEKCPESTLLQTLDELDTDFEDILSCIQDDLLKTAVAKRTLSYRTRLKDTENS